MAATWRIVAFLLSTQLVWSSAGTHRQTLFVMRAQKSASRVLARLIGQVAPASFPAFPSNESSNPQCDVLLQAVHYGGPHAHHAHDQRGTRCLGTARLTHFNSTALPPSIQNVYSYALPESLPTLAAHLDPHAARSLASSVKQLFQHTRLVMGHFRCCLHCSTLILTLPCVNASALDRLYPDPNHNPKSYLTLHNTTGCDSDCLWECICKCIIYRFGLHRLGELPPERYRYMTVFRHPVRRVLSQWNWWVRCELVPCYTIEAESVP